MQIIDVYNKEYTCSKCQGKVNYGKVADEKGNIVTKDKKPFNKKFGKESNALSAAVDLGTTNLHGCYGPNVIRDYDELTSVVKSIDMSEKQVDIPIKPEHEELLNDFESLVNSAYVKLYNMAGRYNPNGTAHDKKLTTFGLMHDFFNYLATKRD